MKIPITPGSVKLEHIKKELETAFPGYAFKFRNKNILVGAKSGTIGVQMVIRKDKLIVVGNFPTLPGQILFSLSMVGLGILIPAVLYLMIFHKKMKAFETEIGEFIKRDLLTDEKV